VRCPLHPTTLHVAVPMFTVEHPDDVDVIEIPDGGLLLEPDQPQVPALPRWPITVPVGYQVQGCAG